MKQLMILIAAMAILSLSLPVGTAFGQRAASSPIIRHQSQCEVSDAPSLVDAYQAVLDFAPNQWTATHTHQGPVCVSQLVGDITFRFESTGVVMTVPAGKAYLEDSRTMHAAGNTTTTAARMLVTNLTPRGKPQADAGPANPNPVVRTFNIKNELSDLPARITIVHLVLDFAPGASTPMQMHGGWGLHTVLAGELTLQAQGAQQKLKAGDGLAEAAGQFYALANSGTETASLFETVLLPPGATLTTDQPAAPSTLPTTGDMNQNMITLGLLLGTALIAFAGAFVLMRKPRRR